MKLDLVPDSELGKHATRILDRAHERIGYNISGLHIMLQTFARTRPSDLRVFLRVVVEECA